MLSSDLSCDGNKLKLPPKPKSKLPSLLSRIQQQKEKEIEKEEEVDCEVEIDKMTTTTTRTEFKEFNLSFHQFGGKEKKEEEGEETKVEEEDDEKSVQGVSIPIKNFHCLF